MDWILILLGVAVSIYGLHRLASHAESRGWIFYRTRPPRVRMLGLLEELVDPRVEYMIEEESALEIMAEHAESGDPEDPGRDGTGQISGGQG